LGEGSSDVEGLFFCACCVLEGKFATRRMGRPGSQLVETAALRDGGISSSRTETRPKTNLNWIYIHPKALQRTRLLRLPGRCFLVRPVCRCVCNSVHVVMWHFLCFVAFFFANNAAVLVPPRRFETDPHRRRLTARCLPANVRCSAVQTSQAPPPPSFLFLSEPFLWLPYAGFGGAARPWRVVVRRPAGN